jgi:hypothetical protein
MSAKKTLKHYAFYFVVFLAGFTLSVAAWQVYLAAASTERRQVLLTTTFKIGAQEQKFKAFYLSAPADEFLIQFNVSVGSVKMSPWQAHIIEDDHGYFDYYVNETTVEKRQVWFFNEHNATIGCNVDSTTDVNQIWYVHFYNEDSYEKEVSLQVTKVWHGLFS